MSLTMFDVGNSTPCNCGGGPPVDACGLPLADLTISIPYGTITGGSGTDTITAAVGTLTYVGSSGIFCSTPVSHYWAGCVGTHVHTGVYNSTNYLGWTLACVGTTAALVVSQSPNADCSSGTYVCGCSGCIITKTGTISPLDLTFQGPSPTYLQLLKPTITL